MAETENLRDRLARQGEDALGKLAQDLLENPLVSGAISRAFAARERAVQAQEATMGALNIPSAADIERLTRRLRSVSQRLEGIEDGVDRLDARLERISEAAPKAPDDQLAAIEAQLSNLAADVSVLLRALDQAPAPVPLDQERLEIEAAEPAGRAAAARASSSSRSGGPKRAGASRSGGAKKAGAGGRAKGAGKRGGSGAA